MMNRMLIIGSRKDCDTSGSQRSYAATHRCGTPGFRMVAAVEIADFLCRRFPQTKCLVEAVGDGTLAISHGITVDELCPGITVCAGYGPGPGNSTRARKSANTVAC